MHWRRKWQPTLVFLPGESQGQRSLLGAVYGVAQSRTRLKRLSSSRSTGNLKSLKWMPESPHCIEISHGLTEPRSKFSLRRDLSQIHGQSPTLDICQILKLHGTGSQKVSLKLLKGRNVSLQAFSNEKAKNHHAWNENSYGIVMNKDSD